MLQELLLDRVPVEPDDGAQPPGDGRASPAPGFEFPGEAFDVGAADGEERQGADPAPGSELAQVESIRLAGQSPVPGQEPGEGNPFGVGEGGLDRDERGGWGGSGSSGHLPAGLEPGKAGPVPAPAVKRKPKRKPSAQGHAMPPASMQRSAAGAWKMLQTAEYALGCG
jgi:hypothetical protein